MVYPERQRQRVTYKLAVLTHKVVRTTATPTYLSELVQTHAPPRGLLSSDARRSSHTHRTGPSPFFCCCSIHLELSTCWHLTVQKCSHFQTPLENRYIQTHLVLLCCIKCLCIFGPKGAIQIRYFLKSVIIIIIIIKLLLLCVVWLKLWDDVCVSDHWGDSGIAWLWYSAVSVSASDRQCVAVYCRVVCHYKTSCYSTTATSNASCHERRYRSPTSYQVRLFLLSKTVMIPPLTSTWPYLRCDVGLEEGEY